MGGNRVEESVSPVWRETSYRETYSRNGFKKGCMAFSSISLVFIGVLSTLITVIAASFLCSSGSYRLIALGVMSGGILTFVACAGGLGLIIKIADRD